ncbi:MAG TPA: acyltransferase [Chloroflexia bacterium]|jgi:acetyltransferase-like isoleucine patch superfamily enzyme|nr:acyltransferase [Chloroflexia bacterium]
MIDSRSLAGGDLTSGAVANRAADGNGLPVDRAPDSTSRIPIPADLHDPHPPRSLRAALRSHGPHWFVAVGLQLIRAQLQLRGVERGRWVRVRGRVRVHNEGRIVLRNGVRFRAETADCELGTWAGGLIEIGEGTTINYGTSIAAAGAVRIGRDCLIGTYVNIMDSTFHNLGDRAWALDPEPVTIGDRVWLGNRCMVMKGVTIGDGAVVAGCSLVTRDVPPNTMVVGVPARVVKQL